MKRQPTLLSRPHPLSVHDYSKVILAMTNAGDALCMIFVVAYDREAAGGARPRCDVQV